MDINIADDPVFIDDKNGAFRVSFFSQNTVSPGDFAMRPEIA